MKTRSNTINSMFMKTLEESELRSIIATMTEKKLIVIQDDKVSYNPPIVSP